MEWIIIIRYERHGNRKYVFKGSSKNGIILSLIILQQAPFIQQNLFASPIKASKNKLANKKNLFLSPFNILPIESITIYWSSIVFRFFVFVDCWMLKAKHSFVFFSKVPLKNKVMNKKKTDFSLLFKESSFVRWSSHPKRFSSSFFQAKL